MKFIAKIITLIILLLTVTPTIEMFAVNNNECSEDYCSTSCGDQEEQGGPDCCPAGTCNPFVNCTCCGYQITYNDFEIKQFSEEIPRPQPSDNLHTSNYSADCWQPPETV